MPLLKDNVSSCIELIFFFHDYNKIYDKLLVIYLAYVDEDVNNMNM